MDEDLPPETETSDEEAAKPRFSSRQKRLALLIVAGLLTVVVIARAITLRSGDRPEPAFVVSEEPVADLLSWLPANDHSRRAFAVWTKDLGLATPMTGTNQFRLQIQLGIEPSPLTLGHSIAWRDRYGWEAGQVTGWATAGQNSGLSVLTGEFDNERIVNRLRRAGYQHEVYREVDLFVLHAAATPAAALNGDSSSAANIVSILDDRLITSSSRSDVTAAIDAARDGSGSLYDDATITGMISSMAPLSALVANNVAHFAAACDPHATAINRSAQARLLQVMVGYGRAGTSGERRTLIAVSYPDEASAVAASVNYENGWIDGFANAGGSGGSIAAFGKLTIVSRSGRVLIAELIEGRDDGWVRAGIRFAIPVCEAALVLAPPPLTSPTGSPIAASP